MTIEELWLFLRPQVGLDRARLKPANSYGYGSKHGTPYGNGNGRGHGYGSGAGVNSKTNGDGTGDGDYADQ